MARTIAIIVLSLAGIFIHPFSPGILDFIFRFLVFAIIVYLLYLNAKPTLQIQTKTESTSKKPIKNIITNEINEQWSLEELLANDNRILKYIMNQADLICGLLIPDNSWLFVSTDNHKISKIFHESYCNIDVDTENIQFESTGIIQLLNERNKILIENNLNKAENLINYYAGADYTAVSVVGIPIQIGENQKLIFVFDSQHKDQFNNEDCNLVEKFAEGIQFLILNRLKAYSLLSSLKISNNLLDFAEELNKCKSISSSINLFAELLSQEYEATRLTICTKRTNSDIALIKKVIGQEDIFMESFEFQIDDGLTGWVISKNKPYLIDNLEKGEYFIPRYTKGEKSNYGLKSFLGIPIQYGDKVFGALTLEHLNAEKYNEEDKLKLMQYVKIFSSTFLRYVNL